MGGNPKVTQWQTDTGSGLRTGVSWCPCSHCYLCLPGRDFFILGPACYPFPDVSLLLSLRGSETLGKGQGHTHDHKPPGFAISSWREKPVTSVIQDRFVAVLEQISHLYYFKSLSKRRPNLFGNFSLIFVRFCLRSLHFLLSDVYKRCPEVTPQSCCWLCQAKGHEFTVTDVCWWWTYWWPWESCNKNRRAKFSRAESFVDSLENSDHLVILSYPLASLV